MIFKDIRDMKEHLDSIARRLTAIEMLVSSMDKAIYCEDEFGVFNRIHDKLDKMLDEEKIHEANLDRLNTMINELKGIVSVTRASLREKKN